MASLYGPGRSLAIVTLRLVAVIGGLALAAAWHWFAGLVFALVLLYWAGWLARPVRKIPKRKVDRDVSGQHAALMQALGGTTDAPLASLVVRRPWANDGELTMPYDDAYLVLTQTRLRMYKGNHYGMPIDPRAFEADVALSRVESIDELTSFEEFATAFPDLDQYHQVTVGSELQRAPIWVIRAHDPVRLEPMAPEWTRALVLSPAYLRGVTPDEARSFLTTVRHAISTMRMPEQMESQEGPRD